MANKYFKIRIFSEDPRALWVNILKAIHKSVDSSVKSAEVIDTWRFKEDKSLYWTPAPRNNWILNAYFKREYYIVGGVVRALDLILATEPNYSIRSVDCSAYVSHLIYEVMAHFSKQVTYITILPMLKKECNSLSTNDTLDPQTARRCNQDGQIADILRKKK